ncbi:MAG: 23S rRNA (adenine(2503)-C(2))-methyltransferase RlmN [Anaerolineales bacterium]|nr:23S rRNA (adenine(2503)-C(2))-methyltransferase RlmN [Anaerolineales bacterium]
MSSERINLYDLSRRQLAALLAGWGHGRFHTDRLWQHLYRHATPTFADMADLRPDLRHRLAAEATLPIPAVALETASSDGATRKYLLRLADGQTIETVLMYFEGRDGTPRATACVSTQAGCAMGCVFCATGQMGFSRHLTPGEIVAQVLHVRRVLAEQGDLLRNVVLMGMGEPLHNYDHTMQAVDILMDHTGLALAPKHITLSTVGVVPGIRRLADEQRPFRLAVSLHGATDAERQALVPPARRWPLAELMDACRYYVAQRQRRIFFEWTLIDGQNDTPAQAHALGQLLHGMAAHVNLIPLNPTTGYDGRPARSTAVSQFQATLSSYGIPSTVRQRRGIDIAAGCGQLRAAQPHPDVHETITA